MAAMDGLVIWALLLGPGRIHFCNVRRFSLGASPSPTLFCHLSGGQWGRRFFHRLILRKGDDDQPRRNAGTNSMLDRCLLLRKERK